MELLAEFVEEMGLARMECGVKNLQPALVSRSDNFNYIIMYAPVLPTEYTCTSLPSIPNGVITYIPTGTSPFDFGATAIYSCNAGFYISMSLISIRVCTGSGTTGFWDGVEPDCLGI